MALSESTEPPVQEYDPQAAVALWKRFGFEVVDRSASSRRPVSGESLRTAKFSGRGRRPPLQDVVLAVVLDDDRAFVPVERYSVASSGSSFEEISAERVLGPLHLLRPQAVVAPVDAQLADACCDRALARGLLLRELLSKGPGDADWRQSSLSSQRATSFGSSESKSS